MPQFDQFQKAFIEAIQSLKVGDPKDLEVLVGPVIDNGHLERIDSWVNEAEKGGAKVLCGGKIKDESHNLFEPTLMTNTSPEMKVCAEEVF